MLVQWKMYSVLREVRLCRFAGSDKRFGQLNIVSSWREVRLCRFAGSDKRFGHLRIESFWREVRSCNALSSSSVRLTMISLCSVP
jgi:hypothetical protein